MMTRLKRIEKTVKELERTQARIYCTLSFADGSEKKMMLVDAINAFVGRDDIVQIKGGEGDSGILPELLNSLLSPPKQQEKQTFKDRTDGLPDGFEKEKDRDIWQSH